MDIDEVDFTADIKNSEAEVEVELVDFIASGPTLTPATAASAMVFLLRCLAANVLNRDRKYGDLLKVFSTMVPAMYAKFYGVTPDETFLSASENLDNIERAMSCLSTAAAAAPKQMSIDSLIEKIIPEFVAEDIKDELTLSSKLPYGVNVLKLNPLFFMDHHIMYHGVNYFEFLVTTENVHLARYLLFRGSGVNNKPFNIRLKVKTDGSKYAVRDVCFKKFDAFSEFFQTYKQGVNTLDSFRKLFPLFCDRYADKHSAEVPLYHAFFDGKKSVLSAEKLIAYLKNGTIVFPDPHSLLQFFRWVRKGTFFDVLSQKDCSSDYAYSSDGRILHRESVVDKFLSAHKLLTDNQSFSSCVIGVTPDGNNLMAKHFKSLGSHLADIAPHTKSDGLDVQIVDAVNGTVCLPKCDVLIVDIYDENTKSDVNFNLLAVLARAHPSTKHVFIKQFMFFDFYQPEGWSYATDSRLGRKHNCEIIVHLYRKPKVTGAKFTSKYETKIDGSDVTLRYSVIKKEEAVQSLLKLQGDGLYNHVLDSNLLRMSAVKHFVEKEQLFYTVTRLAKAVDSKIATPEINMFISDNYDDDEDGCGNTEIINKKFEEMQTAKWHKCESCKFDGEYSHPIWEYYQKIGDEVFDFTDVPEPLIGTIKEFLFHHHRGYS